jgi:hypothetical protein
VPVLGSGIIPAGGINSLGQELQYVVRRAFVQKLVVQLFNTSPLVAALIANSQPASGGVSSVTIPAQGAQFVNLQWVGYDGSFAQPALQPAISNLEFNLKGACIPIPYLGFEGLVQDSHEVIPLLAARMNDAGNVYCDGVGTALFANAFSNLQIVGLPGAVDDGTNSLVFGNQSRATNTWMKSKRYSAGSTNPTRALVAQYLTGTFKNGGEMPTFGLMGPATWQTLQNDYLPNESFVVTPEKGFDQEPWGARSAFRALMVSGVPVYLDPYCPEGILYLLNTGYLAFYIHERAAFAFTGFESTLSNNQIGYIGAVLSLLELINAKPRVHTIVTGFNFVSI